MSLLQTGPLFLLPGHSGCTVTAITTLIKWDFWIVAIGYVPRINTMYLTPPAGMID